MKGIAALDWVTLLVYLIGITVLGVWMARKVKDTTDFFMGGRRFGKVFMTFFGFGAGTHSDQAVSVASKTYASGMSGIWYQWLWLFCTPFYWLIAPMMRRMRVLTTGDYFEARYNRSVSALYAVVGILQLMVNIGVMLLGSSALISAVSNGQITKMESVLTMSALFVIYGIAGGLAAAVVTDFVQGLLTIVLSFMVLPLALYKVGGMTGLREAVNNPKLFEIVASDQITMFYIFMIAVNALVGIVTQPHTLGCCAAGRTESDGAFGFMTGSFIKRFCTIAWMITGLCALALYPGLTNKTDIDMTYGLMARDLLPMIAPGLIGVFIASLLASIMSSCDAFMIALSGLFTENLYRPFIAKNKSQKHYVMIGRISSGVFVVGGIIFAFMLSDVIQGLEIFWKIQAMMGIAFWLGFFWKRCTTAGAWAATLSAFFVLIVTSNKLPIGFDGGLLYWDFNAWAVAHLPTTMIYDGAFRLPWQMLSYLTIGTLVGIIVSVLTKPTAEEKLDHFYGVIRTPVAPDEPHTEPFQLPEGTEPAPGNYLTTKFGLMIQRPSRNGIIGFVIGWIVVFLLIGLVYWIAGIGA
jgi:SSS family transporter